MNRRARGAQRGTAQSGAPGARRPGARRWRLTRPAGARPTGSPPAGPPQAGEPVPASVRRFAERARAHRLRTARPLLVAAAALALLGLVALVLYATPVLGVRDVRVTGNSLVSADDVRRAAGIRPGTPLAGLDLDAVGRRVVAGLAPVRTARVTRDWPGAVVITVTERVGVATAQRADKRWVVLDADAVAFLDQPARPDLPLLVLANPGRTDASTVAALTVLAALTPQLLDVLARVEAPTPTAIRLVLADKREIIWGDATQSQAKAQVATALLGRHGSVIDVSAPDVVTVN